VELVGFMQNIDGEIVEYLPRNQQMKNLYQQRVLFFNMYNFYMDLDLRFLKIEYIGAKNIFDVFDRKIKKLLKEIKIAKKNRFFKVDTASTKIINAYLSNSSIRVVEKPRLQVAKFITLIYKQGSYSLMMDVDDMFLNLVYERIKNVNKNRNVVLKNRSVIIYDKNKNASPTLVLPFYKSIQQQNMRDEEIVNTNIDLALEYLKEEKILQIFLVFPKSDGFSKHIDLKFSGYVKLKDDEYRVKMIPYSFSFCIKNQNKLRRVV
jgi:hypothetical protein